MRTEFTLMQKVIAGFSTGAPTADGHGWDRQPRDFPRGRPVPLPESVDPGLSLREILDRRSSSLSYGTEGLFLAEELASLREALRRDRADWGDVAEAVPLEGFVFALDCIDLAPGVYRVDADEAACIGSLPPPEHWEDLGVQRPRISIGRTPGAGRTATALPWPGPPPPSTTSTWPARATGSWGRSSPVSFPPPCVIF